MYPSIDFFESTLCLYYTYPEVFQMESVELLLSVIVMALVSSELLTSASRICFCSKRIVMLQDDGIGFRPFKCGLVSEKMR